MAKYRLPLFELIYSLVLQLQVLIVLMIFQAVKKWGLFAIESIWQAIWDDII